MAGKTYVITEETELSVDGFFVVDSMQKLSFL